MIYFLRYYNFKGVTLSKRFTSVFVTYQKSNSSLVAAVAFLMFMHPAELYDTDGCDNNTYNCHYNTHNPNDRFYHHILYLSEIFHCITFQDTGSSQNDYNSHPI